MGLEAEDCEDFENAIAVTCAWKNFQVELRVEGHTV